MNTTTLNLRIDAKLKKDAQKLAESLGLSLSTMVRNLLRKAVQEWKSNIGKNSTKSFTELIG